ncbi:DUF551 domain-containing protein [Mesorhizobium sp. M2A.F.Ca.ET.067.02.1.1]|uniref:DUF551 domain-containing protein n=1 Tax=Mesorhizobium sp. M2A.F.Ca.ET.067.02.1.1 TaxID=2496749 RepID=UPI000FD5C018|nr:DUF551 domain-containing protein [Mesorhizobium sp. M2A.F.Ca.ET.067.02.1.1]RUW69835.1 DUF551 domain-containing protein [Mesorhizobium sp. M2A.F.Ca.ET.067.02.1.1]
MSTFKEGDRVCSIEMATVTAVIDDESCEIAWDISGCASDVDFDRLRPAAAAEWQPIDTAPKDGTKVLLWMVHRNAAYSPDPIGEGWAAPVTAKWIDHNGGGWTWHGMLGRPTHWMALPAAPKDWKPFTDEVHG